MIRVPHAYMRMDARRIYCPLLGRANRTRNLARTCIVGALSVYDARPDKPGTLHPNYTGMVSKRCIPSGSAVSSGSKFGQPAMFHGSWCCKLPKPYQSFKGC